MVRAMSASRRARSPDERLVLRRAIAAIDRRFPGGANCVRRSLLEMALDREAGKEELFAGFRRGGGLASGHAWLGSPPIDASYDAVVAIS